MTAGPHGVLPYQLVTSGFTKQNLGFLIMRQYDEKNSDKAALSSSNFPFFQIHGNIFQLGPIL